jgi:GntR family transcriptional repressor for pyruvate dehydrogenase complex
VERQIKDAVLDGRLQSGDFIGSENDLAAEFGVSRLPIREALSRLQTLGVVEVRPGAGGGARIASGNFDRVAEALAIQMKLSGILGPEVLYAQELIEGEAAALAAQRATEEDYEKLERAVDRAEELVDLQHEFVNASMHFHTCLASASYNQFLSATMHAIIFVLYREVFQFTTPEIARKVVKRYRQLVAAIRAKNSELARECIVHHIKIVRTRVLQEYEGR